MQGALENFNVKAFIDAALELVRGDDVLLALDLLEMLPAIYRETPPKEISDLKTLLLSRIATPLFYATDELKLHIAEPEEAMSYLPLLRSQLLVNDVKELNAKDEMPHLVDWGPGNFYVPVMLAELGCFFTYNPITLTRESRRAFLDRYPHMQGEPDTNDPMIFFACEILEHLLEPKELKTTMLQHGGMADIVHISTPLYTFDGRVRADGADGVRDVLGHLRAFTPQEFLTTVQNLFPGYQALYYKDVIQHVRLKKV